MTSSENKNKKMLAIAIGYGVELVVVILVGIYVGQWMGRYWNTEMLGSIIGCFAAFSAWTWKVIRAEQSANKK